ncbi:MAG: hypothetical protein K2O29_10715 [Ruminococcus sp.]|nr:hypothetical protein [Ruminococcus sp.]MDE7138904.1 hypothetical protein [Ruminococcus sp.]
MINEETSKTKRKSKDSVFVNLFENAENVLRLYKELHPEDTQVTVEDIQIQTIKSVLVNTLYNDLGFIVKDRFVMLVEAQSAWNPNMPLRMLFYLAETYRRYLADTVQSEHSSTRVKIPKPELYVVYSGEQNCPETVSFSENFFDGDSPVELKVNVLNEVDVTIYGQYIGFCKVFNEQRKIYQDSIMCAKETIRICIEKGYLVSYLREHEKEVVDMMSELFDEEYQRAAYNRASQKDAIEKGRAEGKAEGKAEGRAEERKSLAEKMREKGYSEKQIAELLNI